MTSPEPQNDSVAERMGVLRHGETTELGEYLGAPMDDQQPPYREWRCTECGALYQDPPGDPPRCMFDWMELAPTAAPAQDR